MYVAGGAATASSNLGHVKVGTTGNGIGRSGASGIAIAGTGNENVCTAGVGIISASDSGITAVAFFKALSSLFLAPVQSFRCSLDVSAALLLGREDVVVSVSSSLAFLFRDRLALGGILENKLFIFHNLQIAKRWPRFDFFRITQP